ncbi:MAG: hypothetical protein AB1801_08330 [Chloroflexota bacterium]
MSKYLLIRVATEDEFISGWPEVAIVTLTEDFIEEIKVIREVVWQHDMVSAEYGKSPAWPIYLALTDVPEGELWDRLETERYLVIETDERFESSDDLIIELEVLSVSKSSFCFKGGVDDQAFETWDVPFDFLEAHDSPSDS